MIVDVYVHQLKNTASIEHNRSQCNDKGIKKDRAQLKFALKKGSRL